MIAFDAGVLIAHRNPKLPEDLRVRIDSVVRQASRTRKPIILPSPAVTEYLAGVGDPEATAKAHALLHADKAFRVAPYGDRASLEVALTLSRIKNKHARKHEGTTWAKAKFDWQIAAIAKVENATTIYTTDRDVVRAAEHMGILGIYVPDMPLPDDARQTTIAFQPVDEDEYLRD